MAHFAEVDDNIVRNVIVVNNSDCGGGDFPDSEPIGQAFIADIGIDGEWLQTSYHANFRGQYAGQSDRWVEDAGHVDGGYFQSSVIEVVVEE